MFVKKWGFLQAHHIPTGKIKCLYPIGKLREGGNDLPCFPVDVRMDLRVGADPVSILVSAFICHFLFYIPEALTGYTISTGKCFRS